MQYIRGISWFCNSREMFMGNLKTGWTLKHYYCFNNLGNKLGGNLITPSSWDTVRTQNIGGNHPFYIFDDRNQWREFCLSHPELRLRAKRIIEVLGPKLKHIYSFGVGSACLEFLIKIENPSTKIRCFDFAPKSIERLRKVFLEAEDISVFDMLKDEWRDMGRDSICLLHRVDTEFSDQEWREIFAKINHAKISDVLFIPSEILTFQKILFIKIKYLIFKIFGKKMTFSGFIRTKQRFISLISEYFNIEEIIEIHDLKGFKLTYKED